MEVQQCWRTFFTSHAQLFAIILWCLLVHRSHTPVLYVYVCTFTGLHRAMPISRLLLQAPEVLALQCVSFTWDYCCAKHVHWTFCTTPTFSKHVLVPINLLEQHTTLCITPTIPISYGGICIATYLQYANSTNFNTYLGFSYPGQIWLTRSAVAYLFIFPWPHEQTINWWKQPIHKK